MTTVSVGFDTTLNLGSAGNLAFYKVLGGVKKHGKIVYTKSLRIRGILFDSGAQTVTISLAKPYKGALQVTIYPGVMSSAGGTSVSVFTNIVQ